MSKKLNVIEMVWWTHQGKIIEEENRAQYTKRYSQKFQVERTIYNELYPKGKKPTG